MSRRAVPKANAAARRAKAGLAIRRAVPKENAVALRAEISK